MASTVTTVPANSSAFNSLGMAVISLDFSSTLRWASTRLLVLAQAETICTKAFLPASRVPHSVLPSMPTTSPAVNLAIDEAHATKPRSISSGSSAANTRLSYRGKECPREASRTFSATPACPRRNRQCRSSFRLRSEPPLWRSEESLPEDVPGSAPPAGPLTQQNTSGDCPSPLLTHFLIDAYSKLWAFICV